MKSKVHIVYQAAQDGGMYAAALTLPGSTDLISSLSTIRGIISANVCTSRKEAEAIPAAWNEGFRQAGTCLFQEGGVSA